MSTRHHSQDEAMQFYVPERLGIKQYLTPEGFLLCEGVPICRTGVLLYGEGEVPVEPGKDGIIRVERSPEQVFSESHILSYAGKPVTDDHPSKEVTPETWKDVAVGTVMNPRRGEGEFGDCMLADFLITDAAAIQAIQAGKREVSCGYDADYEQVEPGRGRQLNLIGNHVALVERGRCGSRCAIGDKETVMATKKKSWKDRLTAAFKAKDEEAIQQIADEMEQGESANGTHVHVHLNGAGNGDETAVPGAENKDDAVPGAEGGGNADPVAALSERLGKIEAVLAKLIPQEQAEGHNLDEESQEQAEGHNLDEESEEKGTNDRRTVFQDTLARAEILVPGFKMPMTMDAAVDTKDAKSFKDSMCKCKRKALDEALKKHGDKVAVFLGGQTVDKLSCATVDAAFMGASEVVKAANNVSRSSVSTKDFGRQTAVNTINDRNRSFWGGGSKQ